MIFFGFMPVVILSETSCRHCVLNGATARKKESVHIESCKKNISIHKKTGIFYILLFFFAILFIMHILRNSLPRQLMSN